MFNTKKIILLIFLLVLNFIVLIAQVNIDSLNSHNAYKVGEKLIYEVRYRLIKGGEASIILDLFQNGNDYVYYSRADAKTTGSAKVVAKIHDTYESYFDMFTVYPVRATRIIQENHYWYYNDVIFNQDSGYVWSMRSGIKKIPTPILDLLSSFYFARKFLFNQGFKQEQIINLTTYFEDRIFPLKIKYKKTEQIKTKFGKIEALLFVPALEEKDNPFKKEDDMQIWFSNDGNFIPLKIKIKTPFGIVKAKLIDYKNLNYPFGIKPSDS